MSETKAIAKPGEAYMTPAVNVTSAVSLPYVIFTSQKNNKYAQIVAQNPGIQEPDPVLMNGDTMRKLPIFKAHFFLAHQLWVERTKDQKAQPLSVVTQRPASFRVPQSEEIHTILLVYGPDGLVPATCTFKKGLCKGAAAASRELGQVGDPKQFSEWVKQSADHRAASQIEMPFARFTATITAAIVPGQSGSRYPESKVTTRPTTAGDWSSIQKFFANGGVERMDAVRELHARRIAELLKLEVSR